MKGLARLAQQLPPLAVSEADGDMLTELAETLALHNMQQYNTLIMTKDGFADARRWKELRRKDGVRVYRERVRAIGPGIPVTPSLLLLGTIEGQLDDVMYGVVATSDEAIRLHSTCTQDGVVDSKVLHELVRPSLEEPFRHASVKWRLSASNRDYVSLDATGIALTVKRERIGYNIMHSVAFAQVPSFDVSHGVERGNMSVCALYRQKTKTQVEVYVRGFFDFHTQNDMLNSLNLQAIATQWLSFARGAECARMKKLVWKMRKHAGCTTSLAVDDDPQLLSSRSSTLSSVESFIGGSGTCRCCSKAFGFLGTSRKICKSCFQSVCTRCCSRRLVCIMAPDKRSVLEKRRTFCTECLDDVDKTEAVTVAREELLSLCAIREDCYEEAQQAAAAALTTSVVMRQSSTSTFRSSGSRRSAAIYS